MHMDCSLAWTFVAYMLVALVELEREQVCTVVGSVLVLELDMVVVLEQGMVEELEQEYIEVVLELVQVLGMAEEQELVLDMVAEQEYR